MLPLASKARLFAAGLLGLALALPVVVGMPYAGFGPTADISCGDQSGFERAFYGDRLGAVDGEAFSGCTTPTSAAYVLAGVTGLCILAAVVLWTCVTRRPQR